MEHLRCVAERTGDGKRCYADGRRGEEVERASVAPAPESKKQKRIVKDSE